MWTSIPEKETEALRKEERVVERKITKNLKSRKCWKMKYHGKQRNNNNQSHIPHNNGVVKREENSKTEKRNNCDSNELKFPFSSDCA